MVVRLSIGLLLLILGGHHPDAGDTRATMKQPPPIQPHVDPYPARSSETYAFAALPNQRSGTVNISLPVTKLPTKYGTDIDTEPKYPPSVTVSVPRSLSNQLAAFGAGGEVIVGPKGWTGQGLVGANGNISIEVHPKGGSRDRGPRIFVFFASPGTGSAVLGAAPYSPWIQSHWKELGFDLDPPALKDGIRLTPLSPHVSRYTLPNTPEGLEVNGAVFSDAQDHIQDRMWTFVQIEVVLSPQQRHLARGILDVFINQRGLLKK